jgi:hypothetical protein
MFEDYKVAIKLTLISDLSKGLLLASEQFKVLDAQAAAFSAKLRQIKTLAFTGAGLFGGAAALAAPFIYATSKAAELQKQMIGIQIATGGTTAQMEKMRLAIEKASAPTMFSAMDVAKMGKIISTSNTFTAPQLTSLLPEYAKFADVQMLLKGTPYATSVLEAVRLAHTANIYDPKQLAAYLNTLTKASIMSGGDVVELGTALKYSQGTAQMALGVDPQTMVLVTALANRMGFAGSRGGTNLIDAMIRTMPGIFGSGLLKGRSNEALRNMGLVDSHGHSNVFTNGKFDVMKWMEGLSAYVSKEMRSHPEAIARQDILTNFQHAFGAQGRRIATLFSSPKALEQFMIMERQFELLASNSQIQDIYVKHSVSQQYQTAITNFQNAMIDLGTNLLPLATEWLNKFNAEITKLTTWMNDHQEAVKEFSHNMLLLGGTFAIAGSVALLASALTFLLSPIGMVVSGITFLYHQFGQLADAIEKLNKIGWDNVGHAITTKFGFNHPENPDAHTSFFFHGNNGQNNLQVHHHYLDGKQIASSTISHMAKSAGSAPAHGSSFNSSLGLGYNMLNVGQ